MFFAFSVVLFWWPIFFGCHFGIMLVTFGRNFGLLERLLATLEPKGIQKQAVAAKRDIKG